MHDLALYCKSYSGDFERVKAQAESVKKFNVDKIPYYISVPPEDVDTFRYWIGHLAEVICDHDIITSSLPPWRAQQVVKSSFWKLGICENYLMLDSDQYFIRGFHEDDFIVPGTNYCYTVMHEQKELFGWTANKSNVLGFDPSKSFGHDRQKIMDAFGRKGRYYDFGPSPILWNCSVWKAFEDKFLKPNNISFEQCIATVPSEFSFYGEFLLADKTIPIMPIEPIFKVFHYKQQYEEYKRNGYTESDIAKTYMGVCLQGNWGAPIRY